MLLVDIFKTISLVSFLGFMSKKIQRYNQTKGNRYKILNIKDIWKTKNFSKLLQQTQQQGEYKYRIRLEGVKKKFINLLMRNGEKSKAQRLFELSLNILQSTNNLVLDETSGELCERKKIFFLKGSKTRVKKKELKRSVTLILLRKERVLTF